MKPSNSKEIDGYFIKIYHVNFKNDLNLNIEINVVKDDMFNMRKTTIKNSDFNKTRKEIETLVESCLFDYGGGFFSEIGKEELEEWVEEITTPKYKEREKILTKLLDE